MTSTAPFTRLSSSLMPNETAICWPTIELLLRAWKLCLGCPDPGHPHRGRSAYQPDEPCNGPQDEGAQRKGQDQIGYELVGVALPRLHGPVTAKLCVLA